MSSAASLKLLIRHKKSHEQRFYNILLALSDDEIEWKFFNETLNFLSKSELEEIIEERISKNKCGYVMCNKLIDIHPTAIVSLDVPKRKIFRIDNRKKFCSDWCYGAHRFIDGQLPKEPAWRSGGITARSFEQYPPDGPGCPGELYYDESASDGSTNIAEESIKQPTNTIIKPIDDKRIDKINNVISALDKLVVNKKKDLEEALTRVKDRGGKSERKAIFIGKYLTEGDCRDSPRESGTTGAISRAAEQLSDWITDRSRDYFCSTENNKKDCDDYLDEDDDGDRSDRDNENEIAFPILDSENQLSVRINILQRRARTSCVSIAADFGVNKSSFTSEFSNFLNTCKLSSTNILFSVKEFKWLIILFIDLASSQLVFEANVDRYSVLKKYGVDRIVYDNILSGIRNIINQGSNIAVSSQGDYED